MLEHQLGAYTDCNHGQGLAVLHPALYRHIVSRLRSEADTSAPAAASLAKFDRWAQEVWLVEHAEDGIDFLADFIRDIGLPTTLSEMGITLDSLTRRAISESTIITPGCPVQLSAEELMEILDKCQ